MRAAGCDVTAYAHLCTLSFYVQHTKHAVLVYYRAQTISLNILCRVFGGRILVRSFSHENVSKEYKIFFK